MLSGLAEKIMARLPEGHKESSAEVMKRLSRLGMSPRQQELNALWAWYRAANYDSRKIDWNGNQAVDPIEHEAIATQGYIPGGFVDAGGSMLPLKFRKPTAPYRLVKAIVDRFTGLLFSERHHPQIHVDGDQDTEEYVAALLEEARLWPQMILARQYGGAMGTVCIGFQFVDGNPKIEIHDPRWVRPKFSDRHELRLSSIEKRYLYPQEETDEEGNYIEAWYWYRRIIDSEKDTLFAPAPVGDGEEPEWEVAKEVSHGLGFCPCVWVQNLPVQDDIDGDPDCAGVYEMAEAIDALLSQANKGVVANSDPTVVITSDMEWGEVHKGSDNALKLEKGGNASYMELTGSGPKSAQELALEFRKLSLEVAQCVLDLTEMTQKTATEVERAYSAMIMKADVMREQYGEKCVKPLVRMMINAIRKLGVGKPNENGEIEKQIINLPPRVIRGDDDQMRIAPQKLGTSESYKLTWPRYFEIPLTDVEIACRSAVAAKAGGLIDNEHAVHYAAQYFGVEDAHGMIARIKKEQTEDQQKLEQQALGMIRPAPFQRGA